LKKQEGIETEIVVVDNCSPKEGELDAIRSLCEEMDCTFIPAKENRGYNAGNNIGLRYATEKGYKYALIANPDMEFPQTDYLMKMVEVMEKDPDIVASGSDIVTIDNIHQNPLRADSKGWLGSFSWMASCFKHNKSDAYSFIDNYRRSHYCDKISGCCLMVNLEYLKLQEFFDEKVFLYCEEAIFFKQVMTSNKKMYYLADAKAIHRHIKSEKGNPIPRLNVWVRSRLYFERNYNYRGPLDYMMKFLGWKFYQTVFILVKSIKNDTTFRIY
jgi:hypothetical protein